MTNILLLRGLARETRHWGTFPKALEDKIDGKVHCLDLPGFGKNSDQESPKNLNDTVHFLREEFQKIRSQNKGDWILVGISLGGMTAITWVDLFPGDFVSLMTINSSSPGLSPFWKRLRPKGIVGLISVIGRDVNKREKKVLQMTTNLVQISGELVEKWAAFSNEFPLSYGAFMNQLLAAIRFKLPKDLKLPYVVIVGAGDRFTHPDCSKALSIHFNAPLIIHPEAGHDLPLDDPKWLVGEVTSFIGRLKEDGLITYN